MSDAAVLAKTGRTWPQWFKMLDAAGARTLDHKAIVAMVSLRFGLGPWWRQMVTVQYERARGIREVHQTARGFQVSVTRTIAASSTKLFDWWKRPASRRRWLGAARLTVQSATPPKRLRIGWGDGTMVEVALSMRRPGKTQVAVEHSRLVGRAAVERMRTYWKARLAALEEVVVTG
jgi:uncharacterized protein YndB with AHSA1/START domain